MLWTDRTGCLQEGLALSLATQVARNNLTHTISSPQSRNHAPNPTPTPTPQEEKRQLEAKIASMQGQMLIGGTKPEDSPTFRTLLAKVGGGVGIKG